MKAFAILPAVAAAILALNISTASSQGACMQEYQACMDVVPVAVRPRRSRTAASESCEGKNNVCAERVYGKRPFNGAPSNVAEQKGQAKDALAKKDKPQNAPQGAGRRRPGSAAERSRLPAAARLRRGANGA